MNGNATERTIRPDSVAPPGARAGSGSEPMPVLECRNLSISFFTRNGEIPAVVDFNLKLMPGEAHGIVGESGCGKSTVALAIMQFLGRNGSIVGGEIRFEGRDMRTMSEEELRHIRGSAISMVYQEPMASLNPSMKVGAQLAEVPVHHDGVTWQEGWERGREMLDNVRLPDLDRMMNAYPHQISGGQQQRVVIAMALLSNPRLLLLDEPTTALDVTVGSRDRGAHSRHFRAIRNFDDLYLAQSRSDSRDVQPAHRHVFGRGG